MKQLVTKLGLKALNLLAKRRLRNAALFGSPGEIAVVGDSHKVAKLV
jgi:hypothetical protein